MIQKFERWFREVGPFYEKWSDFMDEKIDFTHPSSTIHGRRHQKRVLVHALVLGEHYGLNTWELDQLGACASLHDTRRLDDSYDLGHGERAAKYYETLCHEGIVPFDLRTYLSIYYHDLEDDYGIDAFAVQGLSDKLILFNIFKDSDGLDRLRLGSRWLDPDYLRTEQSHEMIDFAHWLLDRI